MPFARNRAIRTSCGASTKTSFDRIGQKPASKRIAPSMATHFFPKRDRYRRVSKKRIGCVREFSTKSIRQLRKATRASFSLCNAPCASRKNRPKAQTMAFQSGFPFSESFLARSSRTRTGIPHSLRKEATVLFPEATPPPIPRTLYPSRSVDLNVPLDGLFPGKVTLHCIGHHGTE